MPRIVIKDLPETLHQKLKEQAALNRRSMAEEALAVLEQALAAQAPQSKTSMPFRGRFALTDKLLDKARRESRK